MPEPRDAAARTAGERPGGATNNARDHVTTILRAASAGRVALETVAASDAWWHATAHRALAWWAAAGVPFDAYDLTELGVPDPDHPSRWGALFAAARAEGLIVGIGYRASRRPSRAGGVCRVWVGAGTGAVQ